METKIAKGFFISGTDTGVGKTWVTVGLLQRLRAASWDAVGMKPVECGGREDANAILAASGSDLDLDLVNPYPLPRPVAPAAMEPRPDISFSDLATRVARLREGRDFALVEGAGGWLVPLDAERTLADLAVHLQLPVIIVAANRLGVLNHTLLTVRAVQQSGLECPAVFLNTMGTDPVDLSRQSNVHVLRESLPGISVIDGDWDALIELVTSEGY